MNKNSPCGRGSWWTRRGVLVLMVIAVVVVHECHCHPVAAVGSRASQQRLHGGGKPARRVVRPIVRPAQCRHDAIFTDCFLCGKLAEANLIYRQCCERDTETVNFCNLMLT